MALTGCGSHLAGWITSGQHSCCYQKFDFSLFESLALKRRLNLEQATADKRQNVFMPVVAPVRFSYYVIYIYFCTFCCLNRATCVCASPQLRENIFLQSHCAAVVTHHTAAEILSHLAFKKRNDSVVCKSCWSAFHRKHIKEEEEKKKFQCDCIPTGLYK